MKHNILIATLDSLFLVVFNISIFCLFALTRNADFWFAFGFVHFAYVLLLCTCLFSEKTKSRYLLSLPNYAVSFVNSILTLIAAIVLFYVQLELRYKIFIYVVINAIGLILLSLNMLSANATANKENTRDSHIDLKSQILKEVERIAASSSAENTELAKKFQDKVKYLPLRKSNGQENFTVQALQVLQKSKEYEPTLENLFN